MQGVNAGSNVDYRDDSHHAHCCVRDWRPDVHRLPPVARVNGKWTTCSLVGQQQNDELLKCHGCPRTFHRQCLPTKHICRPAASGDGEPDILCELCAQEAATDPSGGTAEDSLAELDEKQQAEAQEATAARHEAVAELMQEFDGSLVGRESEDSLAGARVLESCGDDKQLALCRAQPPTPAITLRLVQLQGQAHTSPRASSSLQRNLVPQQSQKGKDACFEKTTGATLTSR